jgi:prepilin-type N-terminal cleavage/methylation domain-containing protein
MRNVADSERRGATPAKTSNRIFRIEEEAKVTTFEHEKTKYGPMELMGRRSPVRQGRTVPSAGFTLVELLVVIGIISLLVSVLLPALNKARQQANLIDCESRLRQMGQALGIYVTENNGSLPYGDVRHDPAASTPWENSASDPENQEFSWYWDFTLSKEVQTKITGSDGLVHNLSPMFHDVDTIDTGNSYRYANHYTCNPRIFPDNWETESVQDPSSFGISPQYVTPRKVSNVKPSSAFLFWDAPQCGDWNNNAYEQATEIDGNELEFGSYLFLNSPTAVQYNRPISPGEISQSQSATICAKFQKLFNVDLQATPNGNTTPNVFNTHLRFRHMGNTVLNALCVDGHVENRTVGTFMVLDVCIKSPG